MTRLNAVLGNRFLEATHLGASLILAFGVKFKELLDVILGELEDLDLAGKDVLKGVDVLASLFDFLGNGIGNTSSTWDETVPDPHGSMDLQLVDQILEVTGRGFLDHDLVHLFADLTHLGGLSVGGLFDLVGASLCETDAKQAQEIAVGGLDIDKGLDHGLPFLDHGLDLVRGKVHAVKVGETLTALDFIDTKTKLAEGLVLGILVQVTEGGLDDATLEGIIGDFCEWIVGSVGRSRHDAQPRGTYSTLACGSPTSFRPGEC